MAEVIGAVGLMTSVLEIYGRLLRVDLQSSGDRYNVLRMQILTQRVRLQSLSTIFDRKENPADPSVEHSVRECLQGIIGEFAKLRKFEEDTGLLVESGLATPSRKHTIAQRIKLEFGQLDKLKSIVGNITDLVNSLEMLMPYLVPHTPVAEPSLMKKGKSSKPKAPLTESSADSAFPEQKEIELRKTNQLFQSLVSVCEQALRLISSSSRDLREIFLSYRLWTFTLESEKISAIFTELPSEINEQRGPNILKVQYSILAHLAWTLCQSIPSS
jgi:hypothetical protein